MAAYKIYSKANDGSNEAEAEISDKLSEWGAEGWRVIFVVATPQANDKQLLTVLLDRPEGYTAAAAEAPGA